MGPDETAWIPIDDDSAIGAARRAATRMAERVHFDAERVGQIGLAVTEAATNLRRHAEEGAVLLRVVRDGQRPGIAVVATDRGPGMADIAEAMRDGYSSGGTLGIGLGAIDRLSTWSELVSSPGAGTVLAFEVWDGPAPPRGHHGALTRPMRGEHVCGDAVVVRVIDARVIMVVVDGLGHGPLAAHAAAVAVRAFDESSYGSPSGALQVIHAALRETRGAAVSVVEVDGDAGVIAFAGIGNVAGWIIDYDGRRGMASFPGIAGHQIRRIGEQRYPLSGPACVVLHSDGLTNKWALDPALLHRDPIVVAATLLRDAGIRHDDASVGVVRARCAS